MKTISIALTGLLALTINLLFGQSAHFTYSGVIEFEKTANMYALMKKEINKDNESYMEPALEQYKKNQPQFKKLKSTLSFADNKTLFMPMPDETNQGGDNRMVNQNNIIFTDLPASNSICQKTVFEETFLVKDSTRKINWKITDETREIAGYPCRRANALVLDSVYVVAFFTEQIPVSGGPESFTGLPGMILGVALPHENLTWFATKVTDKSIESKEIAPPKKGKQTNNKELRKVLGKAMSDWGTYAQIYLKSFYL